MMKKYKNIIFDLGGVVIDIERDHAVQGLRSLGVADAERLLGEYAQQGIFLQLETGEITSSEFYDRLLPLCRPGTTTSDIRRAFEQFLTDIPLPRLATLRRLRDCGFRLFVLSNTNPVMYNDWIDRKFRQEGRSINDYFDGIVVSFQERTCKPDPQIFRNLVSRYRLNPEETLMLDDSEANCEAARSIGLDAIRIDNNGTDSMREVCRRLEEEGALK
ncbi:MAG: HAD family phosphatase [Muribaculaceae bacterium]|nr:HAD family phosphatase [Muribaculaceae bacterium]